MKSVEIYMYKIFFFLFLNTAKRHKSGYGYSPWKNACMRVINPDFCTTIKILLVKYNEGDYKESDLLTK